MTEKLNKNPAGRKNSSPAKVAGLGVAKPEPKLKWKQHLALSEKQSAASETSDNGESERAGGGGVEGASETLPADPALRPHLMDKETEAPESEVTRHARRRGENWK